MSGVDFVQWLRDQLDTDAVRATAAAEEDGPDWRYDGHAVITRREGDLVAVGSQDFMESERGEFIAEHDPARVLREIDAKRRLIAVHRPYSPEPDQACLGCAGGIEWPSCPVLRALASVYVDRPGFREEWRP